MTPGGGAGRDLDLRARLAAEWPDNESVNLVFHGHSVPAGYFDTPRVQRHAAYPQVVTAELASRHPCVAIYGTVTAVGGENSEQGERRFERVVNHCPDVVVIDYALNDQGLGLDRSRVAWGRMIESARLAGALVVLVTPSPDLRVDIRDPAGTHARHAEQIHRLGQDYGVMVADAAEAFRRVAPRELPGYMSHVNHPNEKGHRVMADEILDALLGGLI